MGSSRRDKYIVSFFGLLFTVLGLFFITSLWAMYVRDSSLHEVGQRAQGQVIDTFVIRDAAEGNEYASVYTFTTPDGRNIKSQATYLNKKDWPQKGDAITIVFDEHNPQINFPEGRGITGISSPIFVTIFGSVFTGFGILLLVAAFRKQPSKPQETSPPNAP